MLASSRRLAAPFARARHRVGLVPATFFADVVPRSLPRRPRRPRRPPSVVVVLARGVSSADASSEPATASSSRATAAMGGEDKTTRSIHWFRKGLRVHDNPALVDACADATAVQPIFVLDPWFLTPSRVGANRVRFLLQSLTDLDASLRARGSSLLVLRGDPKAVVPAALRAWGCDRLTHEVDTEPYASARDAAVRDAAKRVGAEVKTFASHTLYDMERLLSKCPKGAPPTSYASFLKIAGSCGAVAKPAPPPPASMPGSPDGKSHVELVAMIEDVVSSAEVGVPTLEELGYPELPDDEGFPARGGETEGLDRLRRMLSRKTWIAEFQKPMTSPTSLWAVVGADGKTQKPANPFEAASKASKSKTVGAEAFLAPSTTALSPYLKFGCVSPRTFYHELKDVLNDAKGKHSAPPVSLEGQLLWREFYYLAAFGTPNYHKMEGNPICRQIPWTWDEERLAAWEEGRTGFPWIDACMHQLRQEGWLHHLARHAVACFLTRGDLFVHWEAGAKVFDRDLVDADPALNYGNWMWLSCSCFFYQYFRVYGPVSFGKKYDKDGTFIRKYLPVLKDMPAKYIYEPWTAPADVQKKAGCVIGVDYPPPIVDHAVASKECIEKLAVAYKAHKDGTNPLVGYKRKAGE